MKLDEDSSQGVGGGNRVRNTDGGVGKRTHDQTSVGGVGVGGSGLGDSMVLDVPSDPPDLWFKSSSRSRIQTSSVANRRG